MKLATNKFDQMNVACMYDDVDTETSGHQFSSSAELLTTSAA